MKKIYLLLLGCIMFIPLLSQQTETVTLTDCQKYAIDSFPSGRAKPLLTSSFYLRMKNIHTNWLPSLGFNAQATYQSDVTSINVPFPGISIPHPDKDQYKAAIDINQVLYDGGMTRAQKKLEEASYQTNIQQVNVNLNQLKDQVNQVYFSILLLQQSRNIALVMLNQLNDRLKMSSSAVKNGIILQSDYDAIQAEILKTEQQIIEIDENRIAGIRILEELTNHTLSENILFQVPEFTVEESAAINRPELMLYDLQIQQVEASRTLNKVQRMPKVYAMAQAGYGKPGFNMLSNKFDSFYLLGVSLKWNIWDWQKSNRERQVLAIDQNIIGTQRESFEKNTDITLENQRSAIRKYSKIIEKDSAIVELRIKIERSTSAQFENGVIRFNDYLTQLNSLIQAKLNKEVHRIQLSQAKVAYLTAKGEL
jgi:outer membrane protein TolC